MKDLCYQSTKTKRKKILHETYRENFACLVKISLRKNMNKSRAEELKEFDSRSENVNKINVSLRNKTKIVAVKDVLST